MNIHKNCKLTEVNRKDIWKLRCNWWKIKDIAIKYNVSEQTISKVVKRARKQEFRPRDSTNHRFRTIKYWLKRLAKIENKILDKKNKEAKRYNKKYPWEMLHLDTKRLPSIKWDKDKTPTYLFVWIDDYSRELYVRLTPDKSQYSAAEFLEQIKEECPYEIDKILTDNWREYKWTKDHEFIKTCEKYSITQAFTKIKSPQTNWKAERVIRTLMDMWHSKNEFKTKKEREISLKRFVNFYNCVKSHKWIEWKTPYEMVEEFYYN